MARCIDRPCGHLLRRTDDGGMLRLAGQHVDNDHPEMHRTDHELRARIAADAPDA